jgi:KAP family P-loop domain
LGDEPYAAEGDPLGFDRIANDLCELVLASRDSTPFTLGIEAGWGLGKSSLMARLLGRLEESPEVEAVEFNAWTADDGKVLEGLVKTVLGAVDQGVLRRTVRDERYLRRVRLITRLAGRFLRIGDVVDLLWDQMSSDPRARNEFREIVEKAMEQWRARESGRVLCVFVDDLDRCSPASVFEVFEAIKLYLDAQGLVFIIGYDADVVSESILEEKRYSKTVTSRHYLEKIVQVVYRIPTAGDDQTQRLIDSYVTASRTGHLLDEDARSLIVERNARNPRRIKRFINGLIVEFQRDPVSAEQNQRLLIRTHLLHIYFPEFARLLGDRERPDPVTQFMEYARVRDILDSGGPEGGDEERLVAHAARSNSVDRALPPRDLLSALEQRLPESFPRLAQDEKFLLLLETLGSEEEREPLREKLEQRLGGEWLAEVKDPTARRVLEALVDSTWEFRTAEGIAKQTRLPPDDVQSILGAYPQFVRQSPVPDRAGVPLFAARSALRSGEGN